LPAHGILDDPVWVKGGVAVDDAKSCSLDIELACVGKCRELGLQFATKTACHEKDWSTSDRNANGRVGKYQN
jgi:hypothetical protein